MTHAPLNHDLLAATLRLSRALAAENAALGAMDLPGAATGLPEKQEAAAAFEAARRAGDMPAGGSVVALREAAAQLAGRAEENRRLLERAIAVQTELLGLVAKAARASQPAPRYGRSGAYAAARPTGWALSARA